MSNRPRLLDLFCGAGGAAMGYHRAGFEVVGVDKEPMPNYPFEFRQADAMTFPFDGFDAVHASPPCQGYANVTLWTGRHEDHERLIPEVRERLAASGAPWVIENVRTPELRQPTMLCGSSFGLRVIRHRYFETSFPLPLLRPPCQHGGCIPFDHGGTMPESAFRDALGCGWMTVREARQAIPPAMTEWIGAHLFARLTERAA